MTPQEPAAPMPPAEPPSREALAAVLKRSTIIAIISFLTLIDLFGAQALLPSLVEAYQVTPAAMGFAVNASTIGMAIAGVTVALFSHGIDRKRGIWLSLALLSIPTVLLGLTDDLVVFTLLRILQGVCMATAFTLTLTYLSEECTVTAAGGAMAAYITGNVASNLFGRLLGSEVAGVFGLAPSFFTFAALNLLGAAIAFFYIGRSSGPRPPRDRSVSRLRPWGEHLANPALRSGFAIGFLLLFVFVGTFTYINFVLADAPYGLTQEELGRVYLVFALSILTTPLAAGVVKRVGTRPTFWGAMGLSALGLALLLSGSFVLVLVALAVIGSALFLAQASATAFIGRTAGHDHAVASGIYLTSYYVGGLIGALALGEVFGAFGWTATVGVLIAATLVACVLALNLGGRSPAPAPAE